MTAAQDDIQRLIECCICCDYLTEVRESPCCHQLFCHSCIRSWLQVSTNNCPRCRSTTLSEQCLLKNIVIQRFVDNLQFDCPHKLQGCPAQIPRCDLIEHKQLCPFSPEKLANKYKKQLEEFNDLFKKYKSNKPRPTDNDLYQLGKSFHSVQEYQTARECIKMMKTKTKTPDIIILQAEIERDDNHFDTSLQFYTQAFSLIKSIPERIQILLAKGDLFMKLAQYGQAKEAFQQSLEFLPKDDQSQMKAEIFNGFGLVAKKCSEYDAAISAYNNALEIVDTSSELWSDIISHLADIHRKKGNYSEAKELYLKSLKQMELLHGHNHPSIADIMNNLGILLKKEGKYNEALNYFKQALRISRHYYGDEHPSIGIYLTNVGDIYRKSDFKKAESTYKEALAALEKAYGPNHIEVAEVLNSMGLVLKKRADYDGAEKCYTRAIEIVHNTFGRDQEHYKLGIYYNNLADVYRKRNKFDDALQLYDRALNYIEKTLGPQHSEAAEILHNIGQVQHQLGNFTVAISHINRALTIIKKEFGENHYKYGMFLNSLGLADAMIDDYQTAYLHLKQSLQILLTALGNDHIEVCDVYANLGDVCMKLVAEEDQNEKKTKKNCDKQSKLDEAKKYYTEAQRIVQATFGAEHTKTKQFLSLLFIVDNYNSF